MIRSIELLFKRVPGWSSLRTQPWMRRALGFEETLWTRKIADVEVRKLVASLDPAPRSALEISGSVWKEHGFPRYRQTEYPPFDICSDVLDEQFDLVIAEHVFEHLERPYRAARNVLAMLRPGGAFLVVTPFMYKVHGCPSDYTRWTEDGLRYFLDEAGFPMDGTRTGSWGNREVIQSTFTHEFRSFNRHAHSLANEPDFPVVVWALARKPVE